MRTQEAVVKKPTRNETKTRKYCRGGRKAYIPPEEAALGRCAWEERSVAPTGSFGRVDVMQKQSIQNSRSTRGSFCFQ